MSGWRRRPAVHWDRAPGRPQVVAHRGSSSTRPEHTLGAYQQALEEGAEALECDVRLTADGHLVCVHDRRIDRTSNGQGPVSTLELAQLDSLDWASWKNPWQDLDDEAPETDVEQGRIVTLERLLDMVYDWGQPVDVAIETKHPTRYAGLVEQRLVETLDRYGWARPRRGAASPARVMSFSWMSLRRCLEMAPGLEMVYLMDRVPLRFRDGTLPLGASIAGPSMDIVLAHPEYVAKVHAAGNGVHVWTVNNPVDIELCASLGVDAIISDNPADALRQLTARSR
ncbi:MAG: glycerophosphodiester phosphodiesterase [Actinomycetota bacterium]|nr:glycerophosphodiester phosphodiesterase [Actinomycetota bacterium]